MNQGDALSCTSLSPHHLTNDIWMLPHLILKQKTPLLRGLAFPKINRIKSRVTFSL